MPEVTPASRALRAAVLAHQAGLAEVLNRYGATNVRLFGSVARGDATPDSDLDLMVDLLPGHGNELLRVAGIGEELRGLLGVRVDVVTPSLLRSVVSDTALRDAVPL